MDDLSTPFAPNVPQRHRQRNNGQANPRSRLRFMSLVVIFTLLAQLISPLFLTSTAEAAARAGSVALSGTPTLAYLNQPYQYQFQLAGNAKQDVYLATGALPAGMQLSPTGLLSGTPTNGGEYPLIIRTGQGRNSDPALAITLVVAPPQAAVAPTQPTTQTTPAIIDVVAEAMAPTIDAAAQVFQRLAAVGSSFVAWALPATQSLPALTQPQLGPSRGPNQIGLAAQTSHDFGSVRIWADTFDTSDPNNTIATGNVGLSSTSATTAFYSVGTQANWNPAGTGVLTIEGLLKIATGAELGNGTFTVSPTGVVTWPTGFVPLVNKIGNSSINITEPSLTLNVAEESVTVAAKVNIKGTTVDLTFKLGANNSVTADAAVDTNLSLAGCTLAAKIRANTDGLTVEQAKLTLPASWKSAEVTVTDVVLSNDEIRIGSAGTTFTIPDQSLGKTLKLSTITGEVKIDVTNKKHTITVKVGTVTITAGQSTNTANDVEFTIDDGKISASVASLNLKIAGLNVDAKTIAYADGKFTSESVTLKLPTSWKGAEVSISNLTISNDDVSLGGAGGTFPIPDISLGTNGMLSLTQTKGSVAVDTKDGDYEIKISTVITINKLKTKSGGNGLTVSGELIIKNGQVSGTITSLEFQVSGVNFSAQNMKFINDKMTVEKASLTLPVKGSNVNATITGLEIGGGTGFKLQGAKVSLPDFKIGTVGVKGVTIEFKTEDDGSYTIAGEAEFSFTQFSVSGGFKLGYSDTEGTSLKSIKLAFQGSVPTPSIPLGTTGFSLVKISGGFDMSDGSATITLGIGAASQLRAGRTSLLEIDGTVTLQIKPEFVFEARAGAKLAGIEIASVDLRITKSSFSLKGDVKLNIVRASLELTFGKDARGEFTFYGSVKAEVVVPRGFFVSKKWWRPAIPGSDFTLGSTQLEAGKFRRGNDTIWGARGTASLFGFTVHAWARFSPGTDSGLGNHLREFEPVRPAALLQSSLAQNGDPYQVTLTSPGDYLMVEEGITETNRLAPQDITIIAPNGVNFTQTLVYSETDKSFRIYRVDFAKPQQAVGTWTFVAQKGNLLNVVQGEATPDIDEFTACLTGGACLTPQTPLAVQNGQTLDLAWKTSSTISNTFLHVAAEDTAGNEYTIYEQDSADQSDLNGSKQWQVALPNGTYTVTAELWSDNEDFAPAIVNKGTFTINDTGAPAAPQNVAAVANLDMSATVTWNTQAVSPDIDGYEISTDGEPAIAIDGQIGEYIVHGLDEGKQHTISVVAYDLNGNRSLPATTIVTTSLFGVEAEWPMPKRIETLVDEVGISFNDELSSFTSFEVVDAKGAQVQGTLYELIGEEDLVDTGSESTLDTAIYGANLVPTSGLLAPGTYKATITGIDKNGQPLTYSWSFEVAQAPPTSYRVHLPLVSR